MSSVGSAKGDARVSDGRPAAAAGAALLVASALGVCGCWSAPEERLHGEAHRLGGPIARELSVRTRAQMVRASGDGSAEGAAPSKALAWFQTSPALFVENAGQWADGSVRFVHQGSGAKVALTDEGPVFRLFRRAGDGEDAAAETLSFRVRFVGARAVRPEGANEAVTRFNYYVGADQSRWRTGLATYEKVVYRGLYPGIDLVVFGRRSHLKYEFHVAPGADPAQIIVRYEGIESLRLRPDGALCIATALGELTDDAPYVYQEIGGRRMDVAATFALVGDDGYTFKLPGGHDVAAELVIDPSLAWSTYLGGNDDDWGGGIAVDGAGNVLVTGDTESAGWTSGGFDTGHGGSCDAFVAKLSPAGAHLWTTYLGGDKDDYGNGIAADGAGNALVAGSTYSAGWTSGGFDTSYNSISSWWGDAFVAKLSSGGAHLWSTYLGGLESDSGSDIAVDQHGNALVTGDTSSSGWVSGGFDTSYNGQGDAFVAKLSSGGAHLWSTYLGDLDSGGYYDRMKGYGIAVDQEENALVIAQACASEFFHEDGLVVKLSSAGTYLWSYVKFTGGYEEGSGDIAVDGAGSALVTFNLVGCGLDGAVVIKLSHDGARPPLWEAYLDGSGDDAVHGIAVDPFGDILLTGWTTSPELGSDGFDTSLNGGTDAFVAKLSSAGQRLWFSYLGGSMNDYGRGIATDGSGNALVAGTTRSPGWVFGGYDTGLNGAIDGFVAKILIPPRLACVDARNTTGTEDGLPEHPYRAVQAAVNVVDGGATARVASSTYSGGLTIAGKQVRVEGGYVGAADYTAGAGDFGEAGRNPDPASNGTALDGGGSACVVACQDAAARGSVLDGLTIRNGGAIFRGGVVLKRVIAAGAR